MFGFCCWFFEHYHDFGKDSRSTDEQENITELGADTNANQTCGKEDEFNHDQGKYYERPLHFHTRVFLDWGRKSRGFKCNYG